jgi:hypothetical protein
LGRPAPAQAGASAHRRAPQARREPETQSATPTTNKPFHLAVAVGFDPRQVRALPRRPHLPPGPALARGALSPDDLPQACP